MDNMLRGYDFVKSQKRGKEFGISKKTGGKKGMKKERKRVLLAWIMAIAMLAGVLQPLTGFSDVQAQESKSAQSKEAVQYEALPKEPMKSSATASSFQDSPQWGDGNAALAFDGDVNKGWHSQYDSKTGPHWIQWSLGGTYEIGRIGYRVKGNGANGRFKDIKVEVKNGDTDWAVVKQETLQDVGQGGTSNIDFEPVQATDVRITISSSYNTNETGVLASAGEIDVYKAVPDLTATDVYHVTYYWEDQDNLAEVRPNKVAPTLVDESSPYYRAETQYGNATVSPGPISQGYQYTFKKVPRYNKRGELAQWKLNPGIYSTNYQIQTEKTGDREFRATYTLNTRKQDKTIRVDWAGADAANRPAIKLQLMYQKWDGSSVSPVEGTEAITLDAANNYTYTWKDMVEYESGKEAFPYQPIYSIEELEAIDGYDIAYSTEKNSKGVYPFNTDGQLVITCTSTTPAAVVTVKVNGQETGGASLEDAVAKAGVTADQVTSLEFVSGTVREQDIVYANANLFGLKTLKLNLNDQLTYETVKGVPSTTFPAYAFRGTVKLVSVELDGFTALGTGAFIGQNYMTSIRIPNVEEIAASAFQLCTGLKNVDLPSVKKIKDSAFSSTALETVNMPVVEEIGALTFRDSGLTEIHIPATIKRFNYHTFGYEKASEDNAPIHFIIDAIDPPVASGYVPFVNCPQDSYITVPEGREEAYLKSYAGDEENGTWHGISIGQKVKEASVTFDVDGTQTVVKVPVGEAIGDRLPEEPKKDGFFFKGWYKAQDGSGEEVTANTIIEEDMTVYAVFTVELNVKAACSNVEETGEVIPTNQDVTVTLTANSSIQDIEGWTRVSDTVLTKAYSQNGTYSVTVVSNDNQQKEVTYTVAGIDKQAPTFQWIVDNSKLEQSKEVRLETSEEIQLPGEGWSLKGQENGTYVYVKTFTANWKDKAFTVTDLAGNVSKPQFVEVKRIDNTKPAVVELTQDITDWTKKDVTVTIKTSVDCATPEGWKKVNKRTFTKVFTASGEYRVTLTSATGVTGDAYVFSITNIDKEAPVIDYAAIEAAKGYKREIPLNEGEEYTEEQLTEMFTKPEWVKDNSGTAAFKVDKWGLEHGLDGYQPFTSKTPGEYKVRFYAYDAAGNSSSFDVYVKVLEPEVPEVEERTTTVNYTVFVDHRVRTGQWTHTGTETGEFTFDLSMVKYLPSNYKLAEGETGYRVLQYGDTTAVTFYLTTE